MARHGIERAGYRLSDAAQRDVLDILGWTQEQFGEVARLRYGGLIVAALRDVASQPDRPGSLERPELGTGVRSWHLRLSRQHVKPALESARRPRHFLVYRAEPGLVVIGRVLHDAMELARHLETIQSSRYARRDLQSQASGLIDAIQTSEC